MQICTIPAAGEQESAVDITKKASGSYRALPTSSKEALRSASSSEREKMTRTDMRKRAEKIGQKINQLVTGTFTLYL